VRTEFTVYREAADRFYIVSAGALETHDHDYFLHALPIDGSVSLRKVTEQFGVLVVAGPDARTLLSRVTDADLSNKAFPWLSGQTINIGAATTKALRVNYVGELGWELHHPIAQQNHIFDALMAAGADLDLKPFGIKAMDSLRLEKSYKLVGRELSIEYAALESGLERFVAIDKGDFIGRDGLIAWQSRGFANAYVTLEVHGVTDTDARGSEPIYLDGALVGRATSGGYGWRLQQSLALAFVRPDLAVPGTRLDIEILGVRHSATVIAESPFDPANQRLRA
jgi:dimethylglycine dehydrogenase